MMARCLLLLLLLLLLHATQGRADESGGVTLHNL